jgi:Tfp pilus assembly protein PilZ
MPAFDFQLGKFSNTARLFRLVNRMSEDKQFILLKTLLRHNVSTYLFQLIIDMNEDQQTQLLDQLTEMSHETTPARTISLDDYEASMRENPRKPCLIQVLGSVRNQTFKSCIVDISTVGVFIETNESFAVGQNIGLAFTLPGQEAMIKMAGKIAWKGLQGIGVKFIKLTADQENKIRAFINKR